MSKYRVLAINPGSTSTKIAVYEGQKPIFVRNIHHTADDLSSFKRIADQFSFRKESIIKAMEDESIALSTIDAIVGRGGLIYPLESGVYEVNESMIRDLSDSPIGHHASNLGGLIAEDIARELGGSVKAYIADPVVVDELSDVARITGHPRFVRRSIFHALNQKAVGRAYAETIGKHYEELNLVVAHLGGGISVGAHKEGRVVDVNNALDGEGPFTPERAGTLPTGDLINLCFSGEFTKTELRKMIKGEGGLVAHLGTNEALTALNRAADGDSHAAEILDALCYNVAKSIGAMAAVLCGKVDAIIITGGMAHSRVITDYIRGMVEFVAPVAVYPGEDEMKALAMNGWLVLSGRVEPKEYKGNL